MTKLSRKLAKYKKHIVGLIKSQQETSESIVMSNYSVNKPCRLLVLHANDPKNTTSSYITGYIAGFKSSPLVKPTIVNVITHDPLSERWNRWGNTLFRQYDAIILLHTIFASSLKLSEKWKRTIQKIDKPVIFFLCNEFYRMAPKMDFVQDLGVNVLVSQCVLPGVLALYQNHVGCRVIGLPNTIYNEESFPPGPALAERPIDLGCRTVPGPASLGHYERQDIANVFLHSAKHRLKLDISLSPEDRLTPPQWAAFLRRSKAQLSVASGGNILELHDTTVTKVHEFLLKNPDATRDEIDKLFPPEKDRVKSRILSPRMVEAASSKTVQIMYKEDIGFDFQPDHDYLMLERNHSNLEEIIDKLSNFDVMEEIAQNCRETIKKQTNAHVIISRLLTEIDTIT